MVTDLVRVSFPSSVLVPRDRPLLPDGDATGDNDGFDIPDGQTLMSRLQWEDSPDISPSDSASSKASKEGGGVPHIDTGHYFSSRDSREMHFPVSLTGANHSDSRKPKKKKRTSLGLGSGAGGGGGGGGGVLTGGVGGSGGGGSNPQSNAVAPTKKKRPKLPASSIPSIYDNAN